MGERCIFRYTAHMASRAQVPPRIEVDEFLRLYGDRDDGRWELDDGIPVMMAGATRRHGQVSGSIFVAVRARLGASGCEAFFDMFVSTGIRKLRVPDVAVFCDPRDADDDARVLRFPKVIFEVLSPSTEQDDKRTKLFEYQRLESVDTIVLVDNTTRELHVFERLGLAEWRNRTLPRGAMLELHDPAMAIPAEEIFGVEPSAA